MHSDDSLLQAHDPLTRNRRAPDPEALDLNALSLDEVEQLLVAGHLVALPPGERAACVPPDDEEPCFSCEPHRPWPDEDGDGPA